jgi:hypothetical protein
MLELPARFVMMRPVVSEDEKDYWDKISEQSEAGHTEWVYQDKKGNDVELMEVWGFGKKYDGRWRNGKRAVWTDAEEKMIDFSDPIMKRCSTISPMGAISASQMIITIRRTSAFAGRGA